MSLSDPQKPDKDAIARKIARSLNGEGVLRILCPFEVPPTVEDLAAIEERWNGVVVNALKLGAALAGEDPDQIPDRLIRLDLSSWEPIEDGRHDLHLKLDLSQIGRAV